MTHEGVPDIGSKEAELDPIALMSALTIEFASDGFYLDEVLPADNPGSNPTFVYRQKPAPEPLSDSELDRL